MQLTRSPKSPAQLMSVWVENARGFDYDFSRGSLYSDDSSGGKKASSAR
jgi:hypothetical protein